MIQEPAEGWDSTLHGYTDIHGTDTTDTTDTT